MSTGGIPEHVRRFVAANIDSVGTLELLLLLRVRRDREWTAQELARELRTGVEAVAARLAHLRAHGLVGVGSGPDPAYRFAPQDNELERAVGDVASAYATRRVSLISGIYAKPSDQLQSFGDAFRIRRRQDD